ncbi:hypothetical protein [Chryseobacterium jejuense]|uniref:hypothetical protein n=1 Tax=Chryseobacterium jejuense TaxID=445960 RepID=UPI001AE1C1E5|nr:hypothetical protein [Chryseobacterium jejuense]MBP2616937.1 hypothetical protein [Chryseobacterium jejuense]
MKKYYICTNKKTQQLDRNYFLSYGQIAFLLLLSAIGKLNTNIMFVEVGKTELLHYTDINNTDLYPYLFGAFSQELVSSLECSVYHHANINDDFPHTAFENSLQSNVPIVNGKNYFLLSMSELKSIFVWNKWRVVSFAVHTDVLGIIKQVKRFYINSVKLIDGFKFIIKIPDKLISASIK